MQTPGLTAGHAPFIEDARSRGELYIDQIYDLYTEENQESWRRLYDRIQPRWERYANERFLKGIQALRLPPDRIPRLAEVNRILEPLTGFQQRRSAATFRGICSSIASAAGNSPPRSRSI
jgi:phenylalanine-4-hydroxylase